MEMQSAKKQDIIAICITIIVLIIISIVAYYKSNTIDSNSKYLDNSQTNTKSDTDTGTPSSTNNSQESTYYKKDANISNTASVNKDFGEELINSLTNLGFTIEEATEIQSIFYKIGINSISNIQKGAGDGIDKLQSFVAYANNDTKKKFYFTVEKRVMFYAGFMDATLYDTSKGGVLTNINDVHIPETKVDMDTYTTLQVKAQEAVKQYLSYPATASFPLYDGWRIARNDDNYKITGKVSAKNGFGVKSDINFSVWFKKTNNQFSIEAVSLDGVRVK